MYLESVHAASVLSVLMRIGVIAWNAGVPDHLPNTSWSARWLRQVGGRAAHHGVAGVFQFLDQLGLGLHLAQRLVQRGDHVVGVLPGAIRPHQMNWLIVG